MSLKEKTSVKQVMKSRTIHSFGLGERHSAGYNVMELLLLSIDKGLTFHTSVKGRYQLDHDKRMEELGNFEFSLRRI